MRRELVNRDTGEMIKLIAVSVFAILLYLCLSFSNAYGYRVSNLDRLKIENSGKSTVQSDAGLTIPDSQVRSIDGCTSTFHDNNYYDLKTLNDDMSDGDKVCPVVPEPSILILFGMGVGTLALYRKLRQ